MGKPLAIDLYAGLFQAKFLLRTNSTIKQLMAGRTQYPNHMALGIGSQSPRAISLKFWAMRDFKNTILAAGLTCFRHIGVAAPQSIQSNIFELPLRVINRSARFIFSSCPYFTQFPRGLNGALVRAISLIGVWLLYWKVITAARTIATVFGRALMFEPSNSSGTLGAIIAAPLFIWANGLKGPRTLSAKQIVHSVEIAL